MKKTVILILAILPIFLLIVISFAGKILSLYTYISVENVIFVDEHQETLTDEFYVSIDKGETYQAYIKVLPELATEKDVEYVSTNTEVCTVDEQGLVTGTGHGSAYVNVITKDGNKIDSLMFSVTDNYVSRVELSAESLEIIVGETKKINATVYPITALNKKISWTSSDSSVVKVDQNGYITALKPGEVEVFVITDDGKFTDICYVTCIDGIPSLGIDFSSSSEIYAQGGGYVTSTDVIDLKEFIVYDETKVNPDDIIVEIESGGKYASLSEDHILSISSREEIIRVVVYIGDPEDPTYITRFLIILD